MQRVEAQAALSALGGFSFRSVRPVAGGWAHWTFEVDGGWIFRFPRTDAVAASTARELALLPALARAVDVRVPVPAWSGSHRGRPFFGYRKIEGKPLGALDRERHAGLCRALGQALAQIHAFPPGRAHDLTGGEASVTSWRDAYRALRAKAQSRLAGVLEPTLGPALEQGFEAFDAAIRFVPVLVHRDLGPEHVLIGPDRGLAGIIDWEDATLGDPAIDFAGLWQAFGPGATRAVVAAYAGPAVDDWFWRRVEGYAWLAAVHNLLHALDVGDAARVADASARLRSGLAAFGRAGAGGRGSATAPRA